MASNSSLFSSQLQQLDLSSSSYVTYSLMLGGACVVVTVLNSLRNGSNIPQASGIPFIGSWAFFTRRHRFIEEGIKKFGNVFGFNILHHKVLSVSGDDARNVFFGSKELNFVEGYRILFGGAPNAKEIKVETEEHDVSWFAKRLLNILRRDRLATTLPLMFSDIERAMDAWGTSGKFNSFDDIYNMVFQLTIRAGACVEISNDPAAVKRVTELFWAMEKGSTPTTVLLPWLPSRARKLRETAMTELYLLIKKHVDDRKATGRSEQDPMQVLIDMGDSENEIVQFIMSLLFAGIINTGIMSSWMVLFLHENPEWKAKAIAEIRAFIAKYAAEDENDPGRLAEQLARVPPEVWDDEMPVLDTCLRETIRIVQTGTALRRSVAEGVVIDGKKVEPGTFLAFLMGSVHHDPTIYPEPEKWDPHRFERGEDKKVHWGFVGWGVGRHPCSGMRFAKLEIKVILSLLLTRYSCELVDAAGAPVTKLPPPHRDNLYQTPPSKPVYVKYQRMTA